MAPVGRCHHRTGRHAQQAAAVGAFASAFITTAAFAEVHIIDDPGGEVSGYVIQELREAGSGSPIASATNGTAPNVGLNSYKNAVFFSLRYYPFNDRLGVPNRSPYGLGRWDALQFSQKCPSGAIDPSPSSSLTPQVQKPLQPPP
jgi:hypothetical protein